MIIRRANSIAEYGFVLMIVAGVLAGMFYIFKRSIQTKVKQESDVYHGHGQGLEWPGTSFTWSDTSASLWRNESLGGTVGIQAHDSSSFTSIFIPVPSAQGFSPMMHKSATRDVQDVASRPNTPDYPAHQREQENMRGDPID